MSEPDEITIDSAINFLEQAKMWAYADEVRTLSSALRMAREERDTAEAANVDLVNELEEVKGERG